MVSFPSPKRHMPASPAPVYDPLLEALLPPGRDCISMAEHIERLETASVRHAFSDIVLGHRALIDSVLGPAGTGSPGRVLNFGCGTGTLAREFSSFGATEVIAVDFSDAILERARAGCPADRMRFGRIRCGVPLPVETASLDAVVTAFGLNVLDRSGVEWAASEFSRVLKPGGVLAAVQWNFDECSGMRFPWVELGRRVSGCDGEPITVTLHPAAPEPLAVSGIFLRRSSYIERLRFAGFEQACASTIYPVENSLSEGVPSLPESEHAPMYLLVAQRSWSHRFPCQN